MHLGRELPQNKMMALSRRVHRSKDLVAAIQISSEDVFFSRQCLVFRFAIVLCKSFTCVLVQKRGVVNFARPGSLHWLGVVCKMSVLVAFPGKIQKRRVFTKRHHRGLSKPVGFPRWPANHPRLFGPDVLKTLLTFSIVHNAYWSQRRKPEQGRAWFLPNSAPPSIGPTLLQAHAEDDAGMGMSSRSPSCHERASSSFGDSSAYRWEGLRLARPSGYSLDFPAFPRTSPEVYLQA